MSVRERVETIAVYLVACCAVVITVGFVHREWFSPDPNAPPPPSKVKEWKSLSANAKRIGPVGAKVTIVEFSDFECPFCAQLNVALHELRTNYPNDVAIVYRSFPLTRLHPSAHDAALAAECAARQGKFASYHDSLFARRDSLRTVNWVLLANEAAVPDTAAFSGCMNSPSAIAALRDDSLQAEAIKVLGTPTVLVNQWRVNAAPSKQTLDSLIRRELGLRGGNSQ